MSRQILNVVSFDTHAEIPATGTVGQLVFCKEHWALHYWGSNALEEPSNMGGGGGPHDHTGVYEPVHAHPFAASAHDHDADYEALGHTHQGGGNPIDAWPVGSVFIAVVATSPATLLGGGTWVRIAEGRMLVGQNPADTDFDTAEETGGAKTHTLTVPEMPAHTHQIQRERSATTGAATTQIARTADTSSTIDVNVFTQSAGGGGAHNNMPPWFTVFMWKRTA